MFAITFVKAAGLPIPPPADAIMLFAAGAAAQGNVAVWQAVAVLLLALVLGGVVQFTLAKGPGRGLINRYGRFLGLSPQRLELASGIMARSGPLAIAVAVFTPGARVASVAACGIAGVPLRRFLPGLVLGNSAMVLLHFAIGYLGGAFLPALMSPAVLWAGGVLLLVAGIAPWLVIRARKRRGARRAEVIAEALEAWEEASCPACLLIGAATRIGGIRLDAADGRVSPAPKREEKAQLRRAW